MAISALDLFKTGIGPSSSHTVGPMVAAKRFALALSDSSGAQLDAIHVELYGSLAHTGRGHGTDRAVVLGLLGHEPATVPLDHMDAVLKAVADSGVLTLPHGKSISFQAKQHLVFNKREMLPVHPNGMRFTALDHNGRVVLTRDYYSVGGGFVVQPDGPSQGTATDRLQLSYHFSSAEMLLDHCRRHHLSIADVMLANEAAWRSASETRAQLLELWATMKACVQRGCTQEGVLPGPLKVRRRAPGLYRELCLRPESALQDPLNVLDWVNLYALAVSEENAAGGRIVTAPTNGAAGIIPAVGLYYERFVPGANDEGIVQYLLTAAAIGILYKENASISGAEVGCQGEVGVACSMAAGGLAAAKAGTAMQVENAAEIAMEHNLGLTCDPVGGLVQVPCIERNAMGAVKALNAARLALRGDGTHTVSLDKVIRTMRETGADMQSKYKETSRGGLAVNVIEC